MEVLLSELDGLGVGFTAGEAEAFTDHFDANHDGRLSLKEFTGVITEANAEAARQRSAQEQEQQQQRQQQKT